MQIQLKQSEIITAIKQFVARQGISLVGKTVDVSFTAGRKETGISADISIEDQDLPDLGPEEGVIHLALVKNIAPAEAISTAVEGVPEREEDPAAAQDQAEVAQPQPESAVAETEAPARTAKSLFS